jgi:hypothetical protein
MIFNPRDWDDKLLDTIREPYAAAMLEGALKELANIKWAESVSKDPTDPADLFFSIDVSQMDVPEWLLQDISTRLDVTFAQDYWMRVNDTTRLWIQAGVENGLAQGMSMRQLADDITNAARGYPSQRAWLVARTEAGGALNGGAQTAISGLEREMGQVIGKQWMSAFLFQSRDAHMALDGEVVTPADAEFDLGGYPCQYPGEESLPAEHRCNCACGIISDITAGAVV